METAVFIICAVIAVLSASGVILARNPVHAALMLVATLFAVAVLFIAQDADFLAAVQVIVYAGAITVLFLFVIMLLGVDRSENIRIEPLGGQRPIAAASAVAILVLTILVAGVANSDISSSSTAGKDYEAGVKGLGESIFSDYVWAFEITAVLLTIAVVAAVVLTRSPPAAPETAAPAPAPEAQPAESDPQKNEPPEAPAPAAETQPAESESEK